MPAPAPEHVQRDDTDHQRDEGGELPRMGNLPLFARLLQPSW